MSEWLVSLGNEWGIGWADLAVGVLLFLVTFTVSLAAVAFILVRLPADYFRGPHPPPLWPNLPPWLRWLVRAGKNVLGVVLVVVGIALSLPGVPGQGFLTILIGLMLIDLPGRRWLEKKLVRRPAIYRSINRIRARFGKPPLLLDDEAPPTSPAPPEEQSSIMQRT